MTNENTAAGPLTGARQLVNELEPLFHVLLKTAAAHSLEEVNISTPRAREIHNNLLVLKKKLKEIDRNTAAGSLTVDRHLDRIFQIN